MAGDRGLPQEGAAKAPLAAAAAAVASPPRPCSAQSEASDNGSETDFTALPLHRRGRPTRAAATDAQASEGAAPLCEADLARSPFVDLRHPVTLYEGAKLLLMAPVVATKARGGSQRRALHDGGVHRPSAAATICPPHLPPVPRSCWCWLWCCPTPGPCWRCCCWVTAPRHPCTRCARCLCASGCSSGAALPWRLQASTASRPGAGTTWRPPRSAGGRRAGPGAQPSGAACRVQPCAVAADRRPVRCRPPSCPPASAIAVAGRFWCSTTPVTSTPPPLLPCLRRVAYPRPAWRSCRSLASLASRCRRAATSRRAACHALR